MKQIFLTFENQTVSWKALEDLRQHYVVEKMLKSVCIAENVKVDWDKDNHSIHETVSKWGYAENAEMYLVFYWLKSRGVKKIFDVSVYDFKENGKKPHSDKAIFECLRDLQVESWDWQRMDIPSSLLPETAGEHIKTLKLYCSGRRAVLQSWSDCGGLAKLKNVSLPTQSQR